jgi:hypothetical protein
MLLFLACPPRALRGVAVDSVHAFVYVLDSRVVAHSAFVVLEWPLIRKIDLNSGMWILVLRTILPSFCFLVLLQTTTF